MADQLYLSLWFPNFRLEALPAALVGVLRQFAVIGGDKRVTAASAYPIDFTETPTYQRIYVNDQRAADTQDTAASIIETAVAEATEQLHDDMAYEFEMRWNLWSPEPAPSDPSEEDGEDEVILDDDPRHRNSEDEASLDDTFVDITPRRQPIPFPVNSVAPAESKLDTLWKQSPATVRVLGFGPEFDHANYAQNGHIRVDFGLDTPWTMDQVAPGDTTPLDEGAAKHIQQNVEMLLAFTLLVEKHCNISSRLLWTESGEPLAEKLIARLQHLN